MGDVVKYIGNLVRGGKKEKKKIVLISSTLSPFLALSFSVAPYPQNAAPWHNKDKWE